MRAMFLVLMLASAARGELTVLSVQADRYGSLWRFSGPVVAWGDVVDDPGLAVWDEVTERWLGVTRAYQWGPDGIGVTHWDTLFSGVAWRISDEPLAVRGLYEPIAWPQSGAAVPVPEPGAGLLVGLAAGGLFRRRRRK